MTDVSQPVREAMARCLGNAGVPEFRHSTVDVTGDVLSFEIYGTDADATRVHAALQAGGFVAAGYTSAPVAGTTKRTVSCLWVGGS